MAAGKSIGSNCPDGETWGMTASDKISFYGATPIVQPSGSAQGVITVTIKQTGAYGFASTAGWSALVNQVKELRTVLYNLGLIKGSA